MPCLDNTEDQRRPRHAAAWEFLIYQNLIMPKAACVAGWCGGGHLTFRPGSAAELALGDGEGAALAHLEVMLFALTSGTRSRGTLVVSS